MMQELLEVCNATFIEENHWMIENKAKRWKIQIFKNAAYPGESNNIWPWKVDKQYFSKDEWAAKYLHELIQEKNTGIRKINHPKLEVPEICGVDGAACRAPGKCNTAICMSCPVAEKFFADRDGVTLQYKEE